MKTSRQPSPKGAPRIIATVVQQTEPAPRLTWINERLPAYGYKPYFILLAPEGGAFEAGLREAGADYARINYRGKRDLPAAILRLAKTLRRLRPAAVHAHLFEAGLAGMLAGRMAGLRPLLYTRHFGAEHHLYHPRAVRFDKLTNRLAHKIVAISPAVRELLVEREGAPPGKIEDLPHGFDLEAIIAAATDDARARLRAKYGLTEGAGPVIGVVSRYVRLKGLQFIIPAFARLLRERPGARLVLANARGPHEAEIRALLQKTLPKEAFVEIPFEREIYALYTLFDVFVHAPVDPVCEAYGQIYVEALALARPCVFTLSGVAREFAQRDVNARIASFCSAESLYHEITALLDAPERARALAAQGQADVFARYGLAPYMRNLAAVYDRAIGNGKSYNLKRTP